MADLPPLYFASPKKKVYKGVLTPAEVEELYRTAVTYSSVSTRVPPISLFDLTDVTRKHPFSSSADTIPRDTGRHDRLLNSKWRERAMEQLPAFRKVAAIVDEYQKANSACTTGNVAWHLMVVDNAVAQAWHTDNHGKKCYATFVVALTKDPPGSGTEFRDRVENEYGGVVMFAGNAEHRGTAHIHEKIRVFLYAALFTGKDANAD